MCDIVSDRGFTDIGIVREHRQSQWSLLHGSLEDMTTSLRCAGHEDTGADDGNGYLRFRTFALLHLPE
jgi:hypothetical protein